MLYKECENFVKDLVQMNYIKKSKEVDKRLKLYEYIKEIEKIHSCNRLLGFQKDENLYIDQTRNYGREYYEKEKLIYGRNCK